MIPFTNIPYNHELFEQQLSEGLLQVSSNATCDLDCLVMLCANCAFSIDGGYVCAFEDHNMSITEPVHMKFKETYPELFI